MRIQRLIYPGVILLFVGMIFGCSGEKKTAAQTDAVPNAEATTEKSSGQQEAAPANLASGTVTWAAEDTRGQVHQATEWIGRRPTVVNFWGTWCPPCRREIPDLVKLYAEYKPKGVEIVSLAVKDEPTNVQVFSQEAKMDWVMLMGTPDIVNAYGGIQGVPTTIFLDKNGNEVKRFVGGQNYETFKSAFDAILQGYTE